MNKHGSESLKLMSRCGGIKDREGYACKNA